MCFEKPEVSLPEETYPEKTENGNLRFLEDREVEVSQTRCTSGRGQVEVVETPRTSRSHEIRRSRHLRTYLSLSLSIFLSVFLFLSHHEGFSGHDLCLQQVERWQEKRRQERNESEREDESRRGFSKLHAERAFVGRDFAIR